MDIQCTYNLFGIPNKSQFYNELVNIFAYNANILTNMEINRIKVVLAETKRKNKWLAHQLGKDESTISQWCSNTRQPSLENLNKIAKLLERDIKDLLNNTSK